MDNKFLTVAEGGEREWVIFWGMKLFPFFTGHDFFGEH